MTDRSQHGRVDHRYPHISIVIPTYNAPHDMQRELESLARVEYPCWDVLVVDQSDDNQTCEIVEKFMPSMPHLRYNICAPKERRGRAMWVSPRPRERSSAFWTTIAPSNPTGSCR